MRGESDATTTTDAFLFCAASDAAEADCNVDD